MDRQRDPLLDALRRVPDQEPPQDLAAAVLSRIAPRRQSLAGRLRDFLLAPLSLTFRPAVAALACAALLGVFGLGYGLGRVQAPAPALSPAADLGPEARYFLGRSLLAAERPQEALQYLEAAVRKAPGKPEYLHWLGVAYWAVGQKDKEREAYLAEAKVAPSLVEPYLALGHSSLEAGKFTEAIAYFDKVLARDSERREALYNRALALNRLGRREDESRAWKRYLATRPSGRWAIEAVAHLNALDDFTYTSHLLGARTLVLRQVEFDPDGHVAPGSVFSLEQVAGVLANNPSLLLHVVVYAQGDAGLAENQAREVRAQILRQAPGVPPGRIALSWFGVAETVSVSGVEHSLGQSVRFIGLPDTQQRKGVKT
jgi:tetratricopeptide (TPR) repeat protein